MKKHPLERTMLLTVAIVAAAPVVPSCKPDFGERESFVDRTQVLAVRVEPAEAKPGEPVTTSMLVVTPAGPVDAPPSSWAFCATPKLLTENGSVSAACLADGVLPIGDGRGGIGATLPASACFDFGPETQSADVRPRDPDVTGGYYLPIRARLAGDASGGEPLTAFGFARVVCNLANAPAELAARFRAEYRRNTNPTLLPVEARIDGGGPASLGALPRGARVVLRASWRPEDAESYALFDVANQVITTRRESLRVSWFTTAGTYERDRSGRTEDEPETFTENTWTAPDEARTSHLSFVLRDSRGGVSFASVSATTR
jgi:hypothetical protein